jgi:hypothetical protein
VYYSIKTVETQDVMMRCLPPKISEATSLGKAVIISANDIICRKANIIEKTP